MRFGPSVSNRTEASTSAMPAVVTAAATAMPRPVNQCGPPNSASTLIAGSAITSAMTVVETAIDSTRITKMRRSEAGEERNRSRSPRP